MFLGVNGLPVFKQRGENHGVRWKPSDAIPMNGILVRKQRKQAFWHNDLIEAVELFHDKLDIGEFGGFIFVLVLESNQVIGR